MAIGGVNEGCRTWVDEVVIGKRSRGSGGRRRYWRGGIQEGVLKRGKWSGYRKGVEDVDIERGIGGDMRVGIEGVGEWD